MKGLIPKQELSYFSGPFKPVDWTARVTDNTTWVLVTFNKPLPPDLSLAGFTDKVFLYPDTTKSRDKAILAASAGLIPEKESIKRGDTSDSIASTIFSILPEKQVYSAIIQFKSNAILTPGGEYMLRLGDWTNLWGETLHCQGRLLPFNGAIAYTTEELQYWDTLQGLNGGIRPQIPRLQSIFYAIAKIVGNLWERQKGGTYKTTVLEPTANKLKRQPRLAIDHSLPVSIIPTVPILSLRGTANKKQFSASYLSADEIIGVKHGPLDYNEGDVISLIHDQTLQQRAKNITELNTDHLNPIENQVKTHDLLGLIPWFKSFNKEGYMAFMTYFQTVNKNITIRKFMLAFSWMFPDTHRPEYVVNEILRQNADGYVTQISIRLTDNTYKKKVIIGYEYKKISNLFTPIHLTPIYDYITVSEPKLDPGQLGVLYDGVGPYSMPVEYRALRNETTHETAPDGSDNTCTRAILELLRPIPLEDVVIGYPGLLRQSFLAVLPNKKSGSSPYNYTTQGRLLLFWLPWITYRTGYAYSQSEGFLNNDITTHKPVYAFDTEEDSISDYATYAIDTAGDPGFLSYLKDVLLPITARIQIFALIKIN